MKITLVTYESTHYHKERVFRTFGENNFPIKKLTDEDLSDNNFLCLTKNGNVFTSSIMYVDSLGYYVDDVSNKICIPCDELSKIYLIEMKADVKYHTNR